MPRQSLLSIVPLSVALSLALGACTQEGPDAVQYEARSLVAFGSCEDLVSYARQQIEIQLEKSYRFQDHLGGGMPDSAQEGAPGNAQGANAGGTTPQQPQGSPAPKDPAHSTTNNQELGVDEADRIKTDGRRIFSLSNGILRIAQLSGEKSVLSDTLDLRPKHDYGFSELLIHENRLLLIQKPMRLNSQPDKDAGPSILLREIDVSIPGQAKVLREMQIEGRYISARKMGSKIRLAMRSSTKNLGLASAWGFMSYPDRPHPSKDHTQPNVGAANQGAAATPPAPPTVSWQTNRQTRWEEAVKKARAHNERALNGLSEKNILPHYRFVDFAQPSQVQTGQLYPCENTMRPGVDSGIEMVSVLSFDLATGLAPGESTAVMAAGSTVYANSKSFYLATKPTQGFALGMGASVVPGAAISPGVAPMMQARQAQLPADQGTEPGRITYIHKFDLSSPKRAEYRASGEVDGELLNQFAMSEHEDILRVGATRYRKGAWQPTDSFVATLQEQGDKLVEIGRVGELGKTEMIRSIRFMGKMGYVVTFRQTDPLYTVDLSVPSAPVVLGELKIEGYSAYLHPLAPGYLLGVGRDADHEGRIKGLQLSIFDVQDPKNPQRVHNYTVADASSSIEWDHRAFLYWSPTKSLAVPLQSWSSKKGEDPQHFSGVYLMGVDPVAGFSLRAKIAHPVIQGKLPGTGGMPGQSFSPRIERSLVVGENLWTLSSLGLKASTLVEGKESQWLPFQ